MLYIRKHNPPGHLSPTQQWSVGKAPPKLDSPVVVIQASGAELKLIRKAIERQSKGQSHV